MLELRLTTALEVLHVAIGGEAGRIPEAHWVLHAQLVLEGPQWRVSVQRPVTPSVARQSILEEHADDRHHGKATICQLSGQLFLFLRGFRRREDLEAKVALAGRSAGRLILRELTEGPVSQDLRPTRTWHLGDGRQAIRHVLKLDTHGWGQVARELACDLRCDVAHGGKHGHPAMLELCLTAALEVLHIAIGSEAGRIPEAHRVLHAQLVLEGPQWRVSVERPVTPSAARQSVLEEHA